MCRIQDLKDSLLERNHKNDFDKILWLNILKDELKLITEKEFCTLIKFIAGPANYKLSNIAGHYSCIKNEFEREYILLNKDYVVQLLEERKIARYPMAIF